LGQILEGSLKPASHFDLEIYRPPSGRAVKTAGKAVGSTERSVLMMLPYPYYDTEGHVGGARKYSEVYIFLQKEIVSELMDTSPRRLYLTHRASVVSNDEWPWSCIESIFKAGKEPGDKDDRMLYHWYARRWAKPTGVTAESKAAFVEYCKTNECIVNIGDDWEDEE